MSILEDKVSLSSIEPKSIITSNNIGEEIIKSSETGLVNSIIDSNLALVPKLIINDYTKGEKVLTEIINGLNKCKEFFISVAFITYSGLLPLLETLEKLNKNGIKGKILTTNYLNFSEPKALKKLLSFSNIQVKMYSKENFHTKGYIFKNKNDFLESGALCIINRKIHNNMTFFIDRIDLFQSTVTASHSRSHNY